jgi:hypothetical protein
MKISNFSTASNKDRRFQTSTLVAEGTNKQLHIIDYDKNNNLCSPDLHSETDSIVARSSM